MREQPLGLFENAYRLVVHFSSELFKSPSLIGMTDGANFQGIVPGVARALVKILPSRTPPPFYPATTTGLLLKQEACINPTDRRPGVMQ